MIIFLIAFLYFFIPSSSGEKTTGFPIVLAGGEKETGFENPSANGKKTTDFTTGQKKVTDSYNEITGIASYYSTTGCLGCSPTLTMANGETLDDNKLTIALPPELVKNNLNKFAGVINIKNHKWVIVKITDTGGFAKYNRVADLSLATKKQLNCEDLCNVIIIY